MLNVWSIYSDVALKSIRKSQKTINTLLVILVRSVINVRSFGVGVVNEAQDL